MGFNNDWFNGVESMAGKTFSQSRATAYRSPMIILQSASSHRDSLSQRLQC